MHRFLMREVVIDAPSSTFAATRDFWAAALLAEAQAVPDFAEFTALVEPAAMSWVGLQDVGRAAARFHLDIETDDLEAEWPGSPAWARPAWRKAAAGSSCVIRPACCSTSYHVSRRSSTNELAPSTSHLSHIPILMRGNWRSRLSTSMLTRG